MLMFGARELWLDLSVRLLVGWLVGRTVRQLQMLRDAAQVENA